MSKKKHLPVIENNSFAGIEKNLKKALAFLAFASIFILFFSLDNFLYPEVFPKAVLFYAVIEIIFALYLGLALLNKKYWPRLSYVDADGQKRRSWPMILSGIYIGSIFLSAVFAENSYAAFFGSAGDTNGFVTVFHFWVLFMVLISVFQEKAFWQWMLRLNVFVGSAISLLALYQKFMQNKLAMGTFGNQGHLSGYLLFIIFLSAVLFFWSEKNKYTWVTLGALNLLTLFLATDIRGSQLGFFVGVATVIGGYFLAHQKKSIRKISLSLAVIVFSLGMIASIYLVSSGKIYGIFERSSTIKTRIINWEIGMKGFLDKPFFGYGPENYYIVFEKHFNPAYYHNNFGGQSTEYGATFPHNKFVEVATLGGIVGLIAYLALFSGIFWLLFRKYYLTQSKINLALSGMLASYLAHLFFLFDNVVTFFLFFSLLAFIDFILRYPSVENKSEKMKLSSMQIYLGLAIIFTVTALAINYFSLQPARADKLAIDALMAKRAGKYEEVMKAADKIQGRNVFFIKQEILFQLGRETEMALVFKDKISIAEENYLKELISRREETFATDPTRLYQSLNLSRLYFIAGRFDAKNYEKSNAILEALMKGGSRRMEVYISAAENYLALGQNDKAMEFGEKAVAIDPTYGFASYRLATLYRKMNDNDKAMYYISKSLKNGYAEKNLYDLYADTAYAKKDYEAAVIAFTKLTQLDSNNPQNFANLAMVYFEKKDYAAARQTAETLIKKFPKLKTQIQPFIDKLPK